MKSKELQKLRDQNANELRLSAQKLKDEIARLSIEGSVNKPKNSNALGCLLYTSPSPRDS